MIYVRLPGHGGSNGGRVALLLAHAGRPLLPLVVAMLLLLLVLLLVDMNAHTARFEFTHGAILSSLTQRFEETHGTSRHHEKRRHDEKRRRDPLLHLPLPCPPLPPPLLPYPSPSPHTPTTPPHHPTTHEDSCLDHKRIWARVSVTRRVSPAWSVLCSRRARKHTDVATHAAVPGHGAATIHQLEPLAHAYLVMDGTIHFVNWLSWASPSRPWCQEEMWQKSLKKVNRHRRKFDVLHSKRWNSVLIPNWRGFFCFDLCQRRRRRDVGCTLSCEDFSKQFWIVPANLRMACAQSSDGVLANFATFLNRGWKLCLYQKQLGHRSRPVCTSRRCIVDSEL